MKKTLWLIGVVGFVLLLVLPISAKVQSDKTAPIQQEALLKVNKVQAETQEIKICPYCGKDFCHECPQVQPEDCFCQNSETCPYFETENSENRQYRNRVENERPRQNGQRGQGHGRKNQPCPRR